MNNCPDLDQYFGNDPKIRDYFLGDFWLHNAKNIIATKTFKNDHVLELSNSCLWEQVLFWVKYMKRDFPTVSETAKIIMDPDRSYFRMNNQEMLPHGVHVSNNHFRMT
mmetsp:Transcript_29247/g.26684  ORF Transcript_29247/g.26684 Transcript_29247/m.26684 type:complete len:108 (+) Transcript_29247:199-522(+)